MREKSAKRVAFGCLDPFFYIVEFDACWNRNDL